MLVFSAPPLAPLRGYFPVTLAGGVGWGWGWGGGGEED